MGIFDNHLYPTTALSPTWGSHSSPAIFYLGKGWQEVKAWQWLICQCGFSGCWTIVALSLWVSTLKYFNKIPALSQFASEIQSFSKRSRLCLDCERDTFVGPQHPVFLTVPIVHCSVLAFIPWLLLLQTQFSFKYHEIGNCSKFYILTMHSQTSLYQMAPAGYSPSSDCACASLVQLLLCSCMTPTVNRLAGPP